ncbi:MAG: lipopolysaccharide biosynthesis protein [Candidatus Hydrogenedentes bacterium]|nr:lipopolysaccharide biosynthesis protein [Candidatus Hydrogenedentota bacterium]
MGSVAVKDVSVAKHAIIYGAATVLSKAVGFVLIPMYTHYLGPSGYGILGMIDICLVLLSAMMAYGMSNAIMRFYYEFEDQKERNLVVSSGLFVMLAIVPVLVCVSLPFSGIVSRIMLGSSDGGFYLVLAIITFGLNISGDSARIYVVINQKSVFWSAIALLRLILGMGLNIYLIAVRGMGVLGYLYSSLIVACVFSIFWHVYTFRKVGLGFSRDLARKMVAYLAPLIPGQFARLVKERATTVILRSYSGISSVGIFELAFKFIVILPLFITDPFFRSWQPRQFELSRTEEGPKVMAATFARFMITMIFVGLILAVMLPEAIKLTSPPEFWTGIPIVTVLLCTRILVAMAQFAVFGILYAKRTKFISYINIVLAVMAVSIGIPMVKYFGLMGAAFTGTIVELGRFILNYTIGQKYYRIPYMWGRFARTVAVAVLSYLIVSHISIESFGLDQWCENTMSPIFGWFADVLHLGVVKNGKLVMYLTERSSVFVNVMMKSLIAPLYVGGLLAVGAIDLSTLQDMGKRALAYVPGLSR